MPPGRGGAGHHAAGRGGPLAARRAGVDPGWLNAQVELDAAYAAVQGRWRSAIADGGPDAAAAAVPACPGWTVRDVTAHVTGLAEDAAEGTVPDLNLLEQWRDGDVASERDHMTAGQVGRAEGEPLDALVARWERVGGRLAPMLRGDEVFPGHPPFGLAPILVTDLSVHAQDVFGALRAPQLTDGAPVSIALATYAFGVDYRIRQLGLGALVLAYDGKERLLGDPDGPVGARVEAGRFELMRAFAGRRSRAQIAALDWSGDPAPYLGIIPAYGERAEPLGD